MSKVKFISFLTDAKSVELLSAETKNQLEKMGYDNPHLTQLFFMIAGFSSTEERLAKYLAGVDYSKHQKYFELINEYLISDAPKSGNKNRRKLSRGIRVVDRLLSYYRRVHNFENCLNIPNFVYKPSIIETDPRYSKWTDVLNIVLADHKSVPHLSQLFWKTLGEVIFTLSTNDEVMKKLISENVFSIIHDCRAFQKVISDLEEYASKTNTPVAD